MFEYIKGLLVELGPTYAVIDNNGLGYYINISVNTYTSLAINTEVKLYVHEIIKEDSRSFFGFNNKSEREMFRHLITVSGVGANTARLILSSLSINNIIDAIVSDNHNLLKSVKGIGTKTAQRITIELKDKLSSSELSDNILLPQDNTIFKDALLALTTLGFSKISVEKVLNKIFKEQSNITLESAIRLALNYL